MPQLSRFGTTNAKETKIFFCSLHVHTSYVIQVQHDGVYCKYKKCDPKILYDIITTLVDYICCIYTSDIVCVVVRYDVKSKVHPPITRWTNIEAHLIICCGAMCAFFKQSHRASASSWVIIESAWIVLIEELMEYAPKLSNDWGEQKKCSVFGIYCKITLQNNNHLQVNT